MKTHESMLSLRLCLWFSSEHSTWMIDRIWSYFPHCFSWIFIYIILFWKIKLYKFIIHSQSYPRIGIDGYDWKWIIQIYIILFFDSNSVENYTVPYNEDNSRYPTRSARVFRATVTIWIKKYRPRWVWLLYTIVFVDTWLYQNVLRSLSSWLWVWHDRFIRMAKPLCGSIVQERRT